MGPAGAMNHNLKFLVLSRNQVRHVDPELDHITISVTDPNDSLANLPFSQNPSCKGVLRLSFHDVDSEKNGTIFTREQARQILDFVNDHLHEIELIVIHCEAGISRSAGIAASLSSIYLNHDSGFFKTHIPNMHVFRQILWEYEGFDIDKMFI